VNHQLLTLFVGSLFAKVAQTEPRKRTNKRWCFLATSIDMQTRWRTIPVRSRCCR